MCLGFGAADCGEASLDHSDRIRVADPVVVAQRGQ